MLIVLCLLAATSIISAAGFAVLYRGADKARRLFVGHCHVVEQDCVRLQEDVDGLTKLLADQRLACRDLAAKLTEAQEAGLAAVAVQERTAQAYKTLDALWATREAADAAAEDARRIDEANAREVARACAEADAIAAAKRDSAAEAAVRQVFGDIGLNREAFCRGFNLARTGKLHDVLSAASHELGIDHGVRSVDDVIQLLVRSMT